MNVEDWLLRTSHRGHRINELCGEFELMAARIAADLLVQGRSDAATVFVKDVRNVVDAMSALNHTLADTEHALEG